jgi:heat shock protein HslJ
MMQPRNFARLATLSLVLLVSVPVPALSAHRRPPASKWEFDQGQDVPTPQPQKPVLRLEGSNLSGSTGCNVFSAALKRLAKNRVTIEQISLTRLLCEPERDKVETALMKAFKQTEYLRRRGKTLTFLSGSRMPLLVWKRKAVGHHSPTRKAHLRHLRSKSVHQWECKLS